MGKRKEFTGVVVSNKMQKTVVVSVFQIIKHRKYSRVMKKYTKFKAHDEEGIAKVGDVVLVEETRPLSKDKRFRVVKVLKKLEAPEVEIREVEGFEKAEDIGAKKKVKTPLAEEKKQ